MKGIIGVIEWRFIILGKWIRESGFDLCLKVWRNPYVIFHKSRFSNCVVGILSSANVDI
jgi:hypothetical protein